MSGIMQMILAGGVGVETDPYFSNVSMLLHMDGTDGGTTFTDSSSNAVAITNYGTPTTSTSIKKYGTASCNFTPAVAVLGASSAGFDFGTGDFTIEFWMYMSVEGGRIYHAATNNPLIYYSGGLRFMCYNSLEVAGGALSLNTWYHIAMTRSGSTFYGFIDGVLQGTNSASAAIGANALVLGAWDTTGSYAFNGYMDDLRITKGVARYTSNFTPPTKAYPNS